ncbi:MAG: EVE domain-containing protein [Vagococcus sp.]|uniref:EVE domain-containing protein n=1 Tax=Vagococcus TaxID=2737 RepID=UPI002FCBC16C
MRRYWIGVVSLNHINKGIESSFIQLCHGKESPLKRMSEDDVIIIYSPKIDLYSKDKYQCFSAIGRLVDNKITQVEMASDFHPFRRNVDFIENIKPVSIHGIKDSLEFIEDQRYYGAKFRYGHFEISKEDAMRIWKKMKPDD